MRYRSNTIVVWRSCVIINKQRVKMSTPHCEYLELSFCIYIYTFRGINIRASILTRILVVSRNRLAPLWSPTPSSSNVVTCIMFFFFKTRTLRKMEIFGRSRTISRRGPWYSCNMPRSLWYRYSIHVAHQLLAFFERSSSSLADLDQRSTREKEAPDHRRWDQLLHRVYTLGSSNR